MLKIKFLVLALCISFAGMFASCYYDYGIDPNNSEIVGTIYNNQYDFGAVTKYRLLPNVVQIGGTYNTSYDALILSTMQAKLNGLGWTQTNDSIGPGVVNVGAGITSGTVYINSGYSYGGYYGYSWYYPDYYSYSYSYTTGTLIMLIADYNTAAGSTPTTAAIQWSGICNAAVDQGTSTNSLITTGINQAFSQSQSPYLY